MPYKMRNRTKRYDYDDFKGTLTNMTEMLHNMIDEFGADAEFVPHWEWECSDLVLNYKTLESQQEYKARLLREEKTSKAREAKAVKQKAKDMRTLRRPIKKHGIPEE